jgi:4-amino-4-deoxy-L-arabinose transferase-like glycosyltransferase
LETGRTKRLSLDQVVGRMQRIDSRLLLASLVLMAVSLRLWGIGFDLPYIYHPDEPVPIAISQNMLKTGDLHPHFFHWPSLLFYINLLAYIPYFFIGKLVGIFRTPYDILAPIELVMGVTYSPMPTTVLLGRLVSIGFGTGSVVLTYMIGKQLTCRTWGGLLAATMMATSPANIWHSRWIAPDVVAVFFVLASFFASLRILQEGRTWQYVMAGICVGLAASSKYNAVLAAVCLVMAHFLRLGPKGIKDGKLYLALLLSAFCFLFTTPFALLDYPAFLEGLAFDSQHYSSGHPGSEGDTLRRYLSYLWRNTGPVCLLAPLGVALGLFLRSKRITIASVFTVIFLMFLSRFEVGFGRTILPVIPFLFLLATWAVVKLFERARVRRRTVIRGAWMAALGSVAVATVLLLAVKTVQSNLRLASVDSRETARVWIADNLPTGAKVAIESYSPFVDPERFAVQGVGRMIDHTPEWYIANGFEYLVFSESMFGRFYREPDRYTAEADQYSGFFERFPLLRVFTEGGYEVRIHRIPERQERSPASAQRIPMSEAHLGALLPVAGVHMRESSILIGNRLKNCPVSGVDFSGIFPRRG